MTWLQRRGRPPRHGGIPAFLALAFVLAGCLGAETNDSSTAPVAIPPSFEIRGVLARGLPAEFQHQQGAGDPVLLATREGTLFLRYSGCSDGMPYEAMIKLSAQAGQEPDFCVHRPLLRSTDAGASWQVLNTRDGRLSGAAPFSGGGSPIAVDESGVMYTLERHCLDVGAYTSVLPESGCDHDAVIPHRSIDGGQTWEYLGELLPPGFTAGARIPVVGSGQAGHAIFGWLTRYVSGIASLWIATTSDGGETFSEATKLQEGLDNVGQPAFDLDGVHAYIPYPVQLARDPAPISEFRILATHDGGTTWHEKRTGFTIAGEPGASQCTVGVPVLSVASNGDLVMAYAGADSSGQYAVHLTRSSDRGDNWQAPVRISDASTSFLPALAALPDDRILIVYAANSVDGDPEGNGLWALHAWVLDLATGKSVDVVVDDRIHEGGLSVGRNRPIYQPLPLLDAESPVSSTVDESLGGGFSVAVLPNGRAVIAYVADPADGGSIQEIRLAVHEA